ncbi:hypothetical protein [Microbacterium tumbae]
MPLLRVDEFFVDNDVEDSFAPNRWGDGRPRLSEIAERLRALSMFSDVLWVRVELHDDTEVERPDGRVYGESVVICATASAAELEARLDTAWLHSDGIVESGPDSLDDVCDVPEVRGHHRIVFLVWD